MAETPIFYDLTEFLNHPIRTGIQRVVYEVVAHWPSSPPLRPVRVGADGRLHALPGDTFALMAQFFGNAAGDPMAAHARLHGYRLEEQPLGGNAIHSCQALLNVELFFDPARVRFYRRLAATPFRERLYFLVYDFLPWLHPEWFARGSVINTMGYLRLIRDLPHLSFISAQTRGDYLTRILRASRATGPVVPLGGDALGCAAPAFDSSRRRFTVVGTLEPRKNHCAILEAFERLWAEGEQAELVFAGRLGWLDPRDWERLQRARERYPQFQWENSVSDTELSQVVRASRATVYASQAEGFGLPPLESLSLGVPVVVSGHIPSMAMFDTLGQVRMAAPTVEEISRGVRLLLDDHFARARTEEIGRLRLPRWSDLGGQFADWIAGRN